jgi:hypothetical protein
MVAVGQAIAFAIVVAGLAALIRWSRRGPAAAPLPLAAIPFALLLFVVPVPLVAIQSIRDFQVMGESGSAGAKGAAVLAHAIVWPLWLGCFGFVAALAASAAVQSFSDPGTEPEPESLQPQRRGRAWIGWGFCASALLIVPAGTLVHLTREVASWLLQAGTTLTARGAQPTVAGMNLEQFTRVVSGRLVLGSLGGSALALVVLFFCGASVFTHRMSSSSTALERVSWAVTAIAGAFGIWTLIALTVTLRSAA